jgi:CO/xanthine dehydrogenase FAD-binding subunit
LLQSVYKQLPVNAKIMANPRHYHRPTTLSDALRLANTPDALLLAGGALTLDTLDLTAETVIDLQSIPELLRIEAHRSGIHVGGAVTLSTLAHQAGLNPIIVRAITRAIPLNIRNHLSVMESLANLAQPMLREWIGVLAVLDVSTHWLSTNNTPLTYNMAELLAHVEAGSPLPGILRRLDLDMYPDHQQALGAAHVSRTPADEPLINAAAYIRLDAEATPDIAFAALCGASHEAVQMISLQVEPDQPFVQADIDAVVATIDAQIETISDRQASAEYRREIAQICVRRAVIECWEQLR